MGLIQIAEKGCWQTASAGGGPDLAGALLLSREEVLGGCDEK